ncbi:hypothetical protein D3C81_1728330 [compost metagenome]
MIECLFDRDVGATATDCDDHFDLVVQVLGQLRIRDGGVIGGDRISRFHEEKRRFTIRVMAHFTSMFGVVAADAVNAADRERLVAPAHGQSRDRREINCVIHRICS